MPTVSVFFNAEGLKPHFIAVSYSLYTTEKSNGSNSKQILKNCVWFSYHRRVMNLAVVGLQEFNLRSIYLVMSSPQSSGKLHCCWVASFIFTKKCPNIKMYVYSMCPIFISIFFCHHASLTSCRPTWQLIAVKWGIKKVAIPHSAGGPSAITIIPDTLDKSLGLDMVSGHRHKIK